MFFDNVVIAGVLTVSLMLVFLQDSDFLSGRIRTSGSNRRSFWM